MFKVISNESEGGFVILPEYVVNKYFTQEDFLFSSDSYTECQTFVTDKLAEEGNNKEVD